MKIFLFLFASFILQDGFSQSSDSLKTYLEAALEMYTKFEALDQNLDSLAELSEERNAELLKRIEERVKASNDAEIEAINQAEDLKNQIIELQQFIDDNKRKLTDSTSHDKN